MHTPRHAQLGFTDQALQAKGGSTEPRPDYCEAFRSGYQLGYSDGYANQNRLSPVFARK